MSYIKANYADIIQVTENGANNLRGMLMIVTDFAPFDDPDDREYALKQQALDGKCYTVIAQPTLIQQNSCTDKDEIYMPDAFFMDESGYEVVGRVAFMPEEA